MKVKEMIELLRQFNMEADVMFNNNGSEELLELYGWVYHEGADCCSETRDITNEKLHAQSVSFVSNKRNIIFHEE